MTNSTCRPSSLRRLSLGFPLLLAALATASDPSGAASAEELEADDTCAGGGEQCALSALQRRAGKLTMQERADAEPARSGHPMLTLELFRALNHRYLAHNLSNVDLATVAGVMNYLHTDVVGEHTGDYSGYEPKIGTDGRINGIDVVVGVKGHIKNPDSVIETVGNFVDFALSAHFISGEATGPQYNWNFGDIVGAQKGDDPRFPLTNPYYRFSLSGYCPNLKFVMKEKGAWAAMKAMKAAEHQSAPESGRRRRRGFGVCMTYSNQYNLPFGEILRGGLCPNGTEPGKMPTGLPGCVYTYEPPTKKTMVKLDELVGITEEDCGGRKCKNWEDWRNHCSNKHYRKKFNYQSRRRYSTLLRTKSCVEYDIHKDCALDCNSHACKRIPAHKREVGLPFWRGRCSEHMNDQRAEKLAVAMGIEHAGHTHQLLQAPTAETCVTDKNPNGLCQPNVTDGTNYCTRLWGGICQPCFIPNAQVAAKASHSMPVCPWDVLRASGDYHRLSSHPNCSSNLPRDLCCLYSSTCNSTLTTAPLNITDDSFAYVVSQQSNERMVAFLAQAARETFGHNITDEEKLSRFAYWQWGLSPASTKPLHEVLELVHFNLL